MHLRLRANPAITQLRAAFLPRKYGAIGLEAPPAHAKLDQRQAVGGTMSTNMTSYETQAWEKLIADERSRRGGWRARGADKASELMSAAGEAVKRIPGAERVTDTLDDSIKPALNGAAKAIFMPAVSSASIERRTRRLRNQHPEVGDASPFQVLDLKALDKGRPKQILPFIGAMESAVASLAITGAEVSTTVSGGATAGVVVLAIVGDISASLALLGRAVAEVAVHYGYDPKEPEEEIFLMGVLSYSTASSLQGKTAALAGLSRLSQQMMRQATWRELQKDVVVKVIQTVFTKIGINLTHRRLAQVVPLVGGAFSAALSYDMLDRALRDATRVYRVRYLADKHGLSFEDWVVSSMANDAAESNKVDTGDEEPINVDAVLQAAIVEGALSTFDESVPAEDADLVGDTH